MNLKSLSIIITFICAPFLLIAQSANKLASGLYATTTDAGIKLQQQITNKYYSVASMPFVSTKHLVSVVAKTRPVMVGNGKFKNISVLTLTFDTESASAIEKATDDIALKQGSIGLVVNGELKSVSRLLTAINKPSIDISFGEYPLEKLKALKAEIEKTH